jgi:SAM-dependent methyltransferase
LNNYYNQCGNYNLYLERYFSSLNISLATALIGYIALVAHEMGGKCFDFGAGIGNLSSTVAKLGHENVYMVETDQKQLDFVKWKDKKCGINNINYIGLDEIEHFFSLQESFQFGAAIELLEHVIDPIGLMEKLGSLIAPGGYLFLIASFHVYPHAGHLQSNVQYTDKEDEILKPFGFKRVNFDNPAIPFLFNWKLFQKEI